MAMIGIDLGTTNSLAAVYREGRVELIPNSLGEFLTPSVVNIGEGGQVYVGKIAREMLITRPECTFQEFKRNMGTDAVYKAHGREYRAEELSALVLRSLKEDAECFLKEPVEEAVISVPAYFNDDKRIATKNAGALAGLKVERLINEPSAVALKHHIENEEMENFLIFDLGGGTLDVSMVETFDNMVEIRAVSGDNYLGGKDFNELIAEYFYIENGLKKESFSPEEQGIVLQEAEALKRMLSNRNRAGRTFKLGAVEYTMEMNNQQLIHISAELFKRMTGPIKKALNDSGMTWEEIDEVILAGALPKCRWCISIFKALRKLPWWWTISRTKALRWGWDWRQQSRQEPERSVIWCCLIFVPFPWEWNCTTVRFLPLLSGMTRCPAAAAGFTPRPGIFRILWNSEFTRGRASWCGIICCWVP